MSPPPPTTSPPGPTRDNHDTQRSESNVLTYKAGQFYNLANYFMLAHPYGHPKVMSSYYFSDTDAGPPGSSVHQGGSSSGAVDCGGGSTWVCEHRRGGIANMVGFRRAATATTAATSGDSASVEVANWFSDDGNHAAFGLTNGRGFFAVNMDTSNDWWQQSFATGMPDGEYCNAITDSDYFSSSDSSDSSSSNSTSSKKGMVAGSFVPVLRSGESCADGSDPITVSNGQATFTVPSLNAVAFYVA